MRKLDVCDMEGFCRLESSEKTIAILGDNWWPQTAKQDGDRISKRFIWRKRNERPKDGDVSIRSRNGAPSRKRCVVNAQMTKASNTCVPPPPPNAPLAITSPYFIQLVSVPMSPHQANTSWQRSIVSLELELVPPLAPPPRFLSSFAYFYSVPHFFNICCVSCLVPVYARSSPNRVSTPWDALLLWDSGRHERRDLLKMR